jgi:hypothetical protein
MRDSGHKAKAFIVAYRKLGSVKLAAQAAGCGADVHYRRMRSDDPDDAPYQREFAKAHEEALKLQADRIAQKAQELDAEIEYAEDELYRRAVHGIEEALTFQGQQTYVPLRHEDGSLRLNADGHVMFSGEPATVNKKSDRMLEFYLKAAKPERYRERHEVKHTGGVDLKFAGSMADLLATFKQLTQEPEAD